MGEKEKIIRKSLSSVNSVFTVDGLGHLSHASYRMDIFIQIMATLSDRRIHPRLITTNPNNIKFNISDKTELFLPYNVAIFSKNQNNHSKIHQRFFNPNPKMKIWILLFDKRPTAFDDFQSLYLVRDVEEKGYVKIRYTEQEMNQKARIENPVKELKDMLTDGRRRSVDYLKTLQRFQFPIQKHPMTRLMTVPENLEILRTPSDAKKQLPVNPTKAGVLSRIRHAYDRKIEKWQRPKDKPHSLSRTRTFTKERIRPEEHFTKEQRMQFLKAFNGGNKIDVTSPEKSLALKQKFRRVFGLDSKKNARDEYRLLAKEVDEEEKRKEKERQQENQSASL